MPSEKSLENFKVIGLAKRLGIFCTYDSEGIIDDYIVFLLREIKKILKYLMIVCNGDLTKESKLRLEEIADEIFVRENSGFDMEAWRQGILRHKENLQDYDEMILFNDSFYGPFYSFAEIFATMDREKPDADFWGITIHGQMRDDLRICPYGYIPEHIQSYFLVIREKMLHSAEFLDYWQNLKPPENFQEAIRLNEVCFTKIFFDKGFSYAALCDTRALEKGYDTNIDHTLINTEKLLKDFKCPILKKKVFMTKRSHTLHENYGDEARKALNYVSQNTNYKVEFIWQNLLRKQNIALTKNYLALDYIFSDKISTFDAPKVFSETAIVAHLYYEDLMTKCAEYLCNAPPGISIIVTVGSESKKIQAETIFKAAGRKVEVRLVKNRGRDMSALLAGCADVFSKYKYLCFVHDKKSVRPNESVVVGNAFFRLLWENSLGGENFIRNILETFENEPQLGLLVPPPPYNGDYKFLFFIAKYWSGACYEKTVELAKSLGIPENFISVEHSPVALGNVFWCRTAALKKVTAKKWKVEDFAAEPMPTDGTISHALERIFPFAAQAEGFYTGWLMTEEFAKNELENFIHFSREMRVTSDTANAISPELLLQNFSALTNIQILKYFLQSRIPHEFWFFFKPFKNLLGRLGFKV